MRVGDEHDRQMRRTIAHMQRRLDATTPKRSTRAGRLQSAVALVLLAALVAVMPQTPVAADPEPLAPGYIETVAGNGTACDLPTDPCGDGGPATDAQLSAQSAGITVDAGGNLYSPDPPNYRVRKIAPDGTITTVAGTGVQCSEWQGMDCGDGGPAVSALLSHPIDLATSPTGELHIADAGGARVRKIDSEGIITTVVGHGVGCFPAGPCGDGGPATEAQIQPTGIAFDSLGNLYVADQGRGRVRKVDATGTITAFAGTGQSCLTYAIDQCGDGGPAVDATLSTPQSVAVDSHGRLLIVDGGVRVVRRVDTDGVITTVAGNGTVASSNVGDGGLATEAPLQPLGDLALGLDDNFFFGAGPNHVRQVAANGIISTVAGTGGSCTPSTAACGDGGPALNATLRTASGLAVDEAGNLFVRDAGAYRIRKVAASATGGLRGQLIVGPGFASVAGVVVSVLADWPAWTPVATVTTDNAGRWSVSGLEPGPYRFRYFDPQGRVTRTWYPEASTYKSAEQVWVSAGAKNPYDAHLPLDAGAKLTGRVTTATGEPVPGAHVFLMTADGFVTAATTGAKGYYLIQRIPPDSYWIYFRHQPSATATWYPGAATKANATTTPVPANTTTIANATLE